MGPVLTKVITKKLEKNIVKAMIESGKFKFCMRYIYDILLANEDDISYILAISVLFTKI